MVENAVLYNKTKNAHLKSISCGEVSYDYSSIAKAKDQVVDTMVTGLNQKFKKSKIAIVNGYGEIIDKHTVQVTSDNGEIAEYNADYVVMATGSKPSMPSFIKDNNTNVMTSKDILALKTLPKEIVIIGGGVIGMEFASILNHLDINVTVLEYAKNLLPNLDSGLGKRLKSIVSKNGVSVETSAKVIEVSDNKVTYENKKGIHTISPEAILVSVGRVGKFDQSRCDIIGIDHTSHFIKTSDNFETSVQGIYAIGDVNGRSLLAHSAYDQGRQLMSYLVNGKTIDLSKSVPSCVFVTPEVASVGISEEYAKANTISYRSQKSLYGSSGKAVAMGEITGFIKTMINDEDELIGLHILGAHATDLVHYGSIAIDQHLTIADLQSIIFAHPTLGELFSDNLHQY